MISQKPGTMDETAWVRPEFHVYTRSAQRWIVIPKETAAFETMPADLSIFAGKKG